MGYIKVQSPLNVPDINKSIAMDMQSTQGWLGKLNDSIDADNKLKQQQFANDLATQANARQQTTFQNKQDELARALKVRAATSDLAKGFDAQSVRPEDLLTRTNAAVVDKYNKITDNGKRELTPNEMQIFNDTYTQGYNPTQSEASQYVSNRILTAGGTAQEAANTAKLLSQQFDTKKEILDNEAAQTKAYNDAEDKRVKREQFLVQMGMKANIANSKGGGKSTGGHYTFAHKPGDNEKYLDLLTNKASPDYMPIKYDDKQAKTLFNLLTSPRTETVNGKEKVIKGYTPAEAYEYITHSKDPGTFGTNYKFEYQNNGKIAKDAATYIGSLRKEYGYAGRNKAAVPGLTDKQIAKITPNYVTSKSLGQLLTDRNNYNKILDKLGKSTTASIGKKGNDAKHKKETPIGNVLLDALNSPKKGEVAKVLIANMNDVKGLNVLKNSLSMKDRKRLEKVSNSQYTKQLIQKALTANRTFTHTTTVPPTIVKASTVPVTSSVYGKSGKILPTTNTNPRANKHTMAEKNVSEWLVETLKNPSKPRKHAPGTSRNR